MSEERQIQSQEPAEGADDEEANARVTSAEHSRKPAEGGKEEVETPRADRSGDTE